MALNPSGLGNEINAAIDTVLQDIANNPAGQPMTSAQQQAMASAYAGAIIDHIKNNAQVTGSSPSGPITGTIL
jgi:hypothetical protein